MSAYLEARPIVVALAGPNGAGKTTFYHGHLAPAALRYLNADELVRDLGVSNAEALSMVKTLREQLVAEGESFVFETVLSDPVGDKVEFLRGVAEHGYTVVLIFIGLRDPTLSDERVAMRVLQGGHDVPAEKLVARFPRVLANLARAIDALPHVIIYDNSDLEHPFRRVCELEHGKQVFGTEGRPGWLKLRFASPRP